MNILMIGSSLNVKGGMTTVVEGFLSNEFNNSRLYYIPTHIEELKIKQLIFFGINLVKIVYYLLSKNISVVHIHFSERGSFTRKNIISRISKLFGKSTVVHMHGAEFKEYYNSSKENKKNKIRKFLLNSKKVIVLGKSWDDFVKSIDVHINTEIMPNFVSCVDEKALFNKEEINILFLAVLIKRKGIYDLIEAINSLIKENLLIGYKVNVIIAGSGTEEVKVKAKVKELGIEGNFDFRGWVDKEQKNELLKKSQIFVLPSYNEGLPVSILEAMSYGLPIISTNVGSIEDAVINNYNGIIINPGNVNQLKEAIYTLIRDEKRWNEFSNNSKYLVEKIYNKDIYFKKIEEIYKIIKDR